MNTEHLWNTCYWWLVHTHPRQEARAAHNLKTLNVETYVPMCRMERYNRFIEETTYAVVPLFPRYIFARFKLNDLYHKVCYTRGVHDLVSFNHCPTSVDDEIICLIQSREDKDGIVKLERAISPGDEVIIIDGPFKDIAAVFERTTSDANRVLLLLHTVSQQTHIIVDRNAIKKAPQPDMRYLQ